MADFLMFWAISFAALCLLAVPVHLVARRRGKPRVSLNFTIAAAVLGALMAITKYTSDQAVASCRAVGNTQCHDSGSVGILVLFIVGFWVVAWARAWNLGDR